MKGETGWLAGWAVLLLLLVRTGYVPSYCAAVFNSPLLPTLPRGFCLFHPYLPTSLPPLRPIRLDGSPATQTQTHTRTTLAATRSFPAAAIAAVARIPPTGATPISLLPALTGPDR
jgi:hypothetical protein